MRRATTDCKLDLLELAIYTRNIVPLPTARPPLASAELLESVGHWESGSQHVEDYRSREDYQSRRTCVLLKHRCDRCEHDEQGVNETTQNAQKPLSPAASA